MEHYHDHALRSEVYQIDHRPGGVGARIGTKFRLDDYGYGDFPMGEVIDEHLTHVLRSTAEKCSEVCGAIPVTKPSSPLAEWKNQHMSMPYHDFPEVELSAMSKSLLKRYEDHMTAQLLAAMSVPLSLMQGPDGSPVKTPAAVTAPVRPPAPAKRPFGTTPRRILL